MIPWIVYGFLFFGTVYGGIIYHSSSLLFLAGVLLLPLFLYLLLLAQRPLLKLWTAEKKYVLMADEEMSLKLIAHNQSPLPIRRLRLRLTMKNLTTGERRRRKLSYALGGRRTNLLIEEKAGYGIWEVSWDRIRMYDLLSFFHIRKWKRICCEAVCLPKKQEVNLVCRREEGDGKPESHGFLAVGTKDRTEICQIREYRAGDRPSDIHWKLSAKREQLQVKEYGSPGGSRMTLALSADQREQEWMELVYSLLSGCANLFRNLFLVWKEEKTGTLWEWDVHGQGGEMIAMELLLRHLPGKLSRQELVSLEDVLWVEGDFSFYWDRIKIHAFSRGHVMEELMETELTL